MRVYILRGVSGSGKSTFAKKIKNSKTHSTDSFFYKSGRYMFDISKVEEFHQKNFENYLNSLKRKKVNIIIDNTNLNPLFVQPYIEKAKAHGYKVILVDFIPKGREWHVKRNIHNVPKSVIDFQKKEYFKYKKFFYSSVDKIIKIL